MQLPAMLQAESRKRLIQGAVAGAVITMIGGFGLLNWHSDGGARKMASQTAEAAVLKALAPVCAALFNQLATPAQWADFKTKQSYDRNDLIQQVVKIPGQESLDYGLRSDCGDLLAKSVAKSAQK